MKINKLCFSYFSVPFGKKLQYRILKDICIWNISDLNNMNLILGFHVPTIQLQQLSTSAILILSILPLPAPNSTVLTNG